MVLVNPKGPDGSHADTATLDQSIMTNQAYLGRKRQFPQANQFGLYDYLPKRQALEKLESEREQKQ